MSLVQTLFLNTIPTRFGTAILGIPELYQQNTVAPCVPQFDFPEKEPVLPALVKNCIETSTLLPSFVLDVYHLFPFQVEPNDNGHMRHYAENRVSCSDVFRFGNITAAGNKWVKVSFKFIFSYNLKASKKISYQ